MLQYGSLLLEVCDTKEQLGIKTRRRIDDRLYRDLRFHKLTVGAGKPVECEKTYTRNNAHRVEIVKQWITFLRNRGVMTANSRRVKNSNVVVPLIYRTESINSLLKSFTQRK